MILILLVFEIFLCVFLLIAVAYLTLAERKILGAMQLRLGPASIGVFGLFQPFADGLKLLLKQTIFPRGVNRFFFIFAPILIFSLSLFVWISVPFSPTSVFVDLEFGVLFWLAISSLSVYGIVLAGWASNSKYALIGAIRSAAQMVSYELILGLIFINVLLAVGSLNPLEIVFSQKQIFFLFPFFPLFFFFLIACLAETNRTPFDLPEAEAELVAGYNVEYSSIAFALFFLSEYSSMIFMSSVTTILFLGGWLPFFSGLIKLPLFIWFGLKVSLILFFFIWVRATFPRYRYDQLMQIGWKILLPLTLSYLFFSVIVLKTIV